MHEVLFGCDDIDSYWSNVMYILYNGIIGTGNEI